MDGVLLVDKPSGLSSYDVIRQIKKVIPGVKIGHAGTLDPAATGLLIILLGGACKQADQFLKLDKSYDAEITLGFTSNTDDAEGEIVEISKQEPEISEVERVLKEFTGEISQIPPQHSAIKVGGRRAYVMARNGQIVDLKPRSVKVHEIKLVSYDYPKLQIATNVSSGTYIRSLARDIGKSLGIGAYLSGLRRQSTGQYKVQNSVQLGGLGESMIKKNIISIQAKA